MIIGPPFLIYMFQEFEFRFMGDFIIINDLAHKIIYKMTFPRDCDIPFQLEILEKY